MKRGLVLGLLVVLLPLAATATTTRVYTMGGSQDLVWDQSNVFTYPSNILHWSDWVTADIGTGSDAHHTVWASWDTETAGTWGLSLSGVQGNSSPFTTWGDPQFGNTLGLHWGYAIDEETGVGLMVNVTNNSEEVTETTDGETTTEEHTYGAYDVRAGGHAMLGPFERVDGAFNFHTHSQEMKAADKAASDKWDTSWFGFDARGQWVWTEKMTFVPAFHFFSASDDVEYAGIDDTEEGTTTYFDLLAGARYAVTKKANVVAGVGFRTWKEEWTSTWTDKASETEENKFTDLPYYVVGLEAQVWDWFDFRLGATKAQRSTTDELSSDDGTSTTETKYSNLDITYGFGLHFGSFWVDAAFDNDFLYNWGYLASGNEQNPVTRVSVGYNWK